MTERIVFEVTGSRPEPYRITFNRDANAGSFWVTCTCQAARRGMACKHRLDLLRGVIDAIVSFDSSAFAMAHQWAQDDGRLLSAIAHLDELERHRLDTSPRMLDAARARLTNALLGRHSES